MKSKISKYPVIIHVLKLVPTNINQHYHAMHLVVNLQQLATREVGMLGIAFRSKPGHPCKGLD